MLSGWGKVVLLEREARFRGDAAAAAQWPLFVECNVARIGGGVGFVWSEDIDFGVMLVLRRRVWFS